MSIDSEAAAVALKYKKIIRFAAAKATRKYAAYLRAKGDLAAFTFGDIDQIALEGMLILAGLVPGRKLSFTGKLKEVEARGGERWVQHTIDCFVSTTLNGMIAKTDTLKRAARVQSLDALLWEEPSKSPTEANPEALTGISAGYPCLWLTEIQGMSRPEAIRSLGLPRKVYEEKRREEIERFSAWAYANHRVAA